MEHNVSRINEFNREPESLKGCCSIWRSVLIRNHCDDDDNTHLAIVCDVVIFSGAMAKISPSNDTRRLTSRRSLGLTNGRWANSAKVT